MIVKRIVTQVKPGPAQERLFDSLPTDPGLDEGPKLEAAPRASFVDPSPTKLTIGPESLDAYLKSSRRTDVFEVRRLVRSVDYTEFFKRYLAQGRAPYHPALMVGLILYSLMRGRRSLREIEDFARENVSAWWLTGGACPDHASIGRFIERFGDLLVGELFEQLTAKILKETGTSGSDLAGDGTTIASMASRFGLLQEEAAKKKAAELRAKAATLDTERGAKLREELVKKAESYERAAKATQRVVQATGKNPKTRSVKVARSDPEATNQKLKNGLPAPSYKPTIFANEARIVVAQDVQSSNENAAVDGLCEQAKRVGGGELDCVRLDAGFFSREVLHTLLEHEVANPLVTDKPVVAEKRDSKKPKKPKLFPKTRFDYDPETDTYNCPAGHPLTLVKNRKARRTKIYGDAPCASCPLRSNCTKSKKGREIERYEHDELKEAMREVMENPLARMDYKRRSAMVEPVFADLRQRQHFTRFLRSGLEKARIESALHMTAYNVSKWLSLMTLLVVLVALIVPLLAHLSAFWDRLRQLLEPSPRADGVASALSGSLWMA